MTIDEEKCISDLKQAFLSYHNISEQSFALIESIVQFQEFKKNEILLHEGQIAKNIQFISKGAVIAYIVDESGNNYNKNIFFEKQFAGSIVSALLRIPSRFTLQAIENCLVLNINYKKYKEYIYANDDLKNFYIAYLEKNWVIDKEEREVSIVMESGTTRYQKLLENYPNIDKRISLQHIASHLGITATQLSRIRKNLQEK